MQSSQLWQIILYLLISCILHSSKGGSRKKDILKSSLELLDKEKSRINGKKESCDLKTITTSKLDSLRITKQIDKAIACHIEALQNDREDGWIWSSLGELYVHSSNVPKSSSLATTCFKQAVKLSGKVSHYVTLWHFLGPFVIGKIEVDGDPIETYGGIVNASKERYSKKFKAFSEYVPDGTVAWSSYKVNSAQEPVRIVSQVNWNDLINSLGSIAITEWQGWTVGEIAVNDNNQNVLIQCLGVHTLYIDDALTPVTGDVYRRNQFWFSVSLDKGIHTVYIKHRTKQAQVFQCTLTTASSTYEILKPHFLPDLYDGYLFSNRITLPVSNYHSTKWLKISKISIANQSSGKQLRIEKFSEEVVIAPGQILPVNLVLRTEKDEDAELQLIEQCQGDKAIHLSLRVNTNEGQQFPLDLRCRKRHESFLFTFEDHDGSVQHGAAIEPIDECQENECQRSVLLTLHGTTVPPQNQADSYKHMVDGKYVFGLEKAWTLAPTRHGAHNWEGPGALTAMTALDFLSERTHSAPWLTSKANKEYVIFAGHSMGGHGAWHLATHFPDRALGVIALAGWNRKEDYGDSNLFFRHDIAVSSVDPATKVVMEACIAENEADKHASNLKGISVLARIGGNDRTVHPFFVRRMVRVLRWWDVNISYTELPGKEHWWWDTIETNDGGAVNDKQLRDFMNAHSEIPTKERTCDAQKCGHTDNKYTKEHNEESFVFTVVNPAFAGSMRGIKILHQIIPMRTSTVEVNVEDHKFHVTTVNVKKLMINDDLAPIRPLLWQNKQVMMDGNVISEAGNRRELCLCLESGAWSECDYCNSDLSSSSRSLNTLGPARRVAEKPFLIVTGTIGTVSDTQQLKDYAVYIANLFFLTSDTAAPIVKDIDLTIATSGTHNLIVIGSPSQNSQTSNYLEKISIKITSKGINLGNCQYSESQTGVLFLAPHNNGESLALVLMGNTMQGLWDVVSLATPTIPPMTRSPFSNLIPDYVVTGPDYRSRGPGGYSCAGFWDNNWKGSAALSSCGHCWV